MAINPGHCVLTVAEAAALTGFSRDTITRMFQDEPGVLVLARPTTNRKRRYRSIRIPRAVYERVVRRLTV
jgi:predicted DNA-binding transcriptional regulator AlpA